MLSTNVNILWREFFGCDFYWDDFGATSLILGWLLRNHLNVNILYFVKYFQRRSLHYQDGRYNWLIIQTINIWFLLSFFKAGKFEKFRSYRWFASVHEAVLVRVLDVERFPSVQFPTLADFFHNFTGASFVTRFQTVGCNSRFIWLLILISPVSYWKFPLSKSMKKIHAP